MTRARTLLARAAVAALLLVALGSAAADAATLRAPAQMFTPVDPGYPQLTALTPVDPGYDR